MSDFIEITYDKFIFRVKTDCLYMREGFWAHVDNQTATVGVTDFQQKIMGDVAYLGTVDPGTLVRQGQAFGQIETIKATADILSPVSGKVAEVNPQMQESPFLINQDPHGAGWIYRIELTNLQSDMKGLITAEEYCEFMKNKLEKEAHKQNG